MLSSIFIDRPRLCDRHLARDHDRRRHRDVRASRSPSSPTSCRRRCRSRRAIPAPAPTVVEQTVAQPIESQVVGVDKMLYMKSTSGNDGSYTLTVSFAVGTDPDINTVNVNNRVQLAMPQLPEDVSAQGVSVKKKSSAILQVLAVYSPDERYDTLFLSNYATINILDSIKRVAGRRRRVPVRRARLQHAGLGQHRPDDGTRADAERHRQGAAGRRTSRRRSAASAPSRAATTSSSSSTSRPRAG